MVQRTSNEEFDAKCMILTVKYRGGLGLFHPAGSWKIVCIRSYHEQISRSRYFGTNLQPSINHFKLGQQCIFMHDNDPQHTSGLIKDWLKRKRIQTLRWPPYSPDFSPIENLWDELERRVKKHQPKNIPQLEPLLIQEWNKIELPVLEKLVDSVPSRLYECIKLKGYPTKY